jgi:hypothetical protein
VPYKWPQAMKERAREHRLEALTSYMTSWPNELVILTANL